MENKKHTTPELLAPAGNMEKLIFAAQYGADAVYFGTEFGSLRAYAGNFTLDEAETAIKYLHEKNKKAYVTLNIYPFSDEYDRLVKIAGTLAETGADALIIADIGLMREIRKAGVKTPIHVSTQANTTSAQTVLAYAELGAVRVNLARELSCEQIEHIQKQIAGNNVEIETEIFIHGAVCFSYSGRCAVSDYMTGRGANRGECTHPCRWAYHLVEEQRPGEYLPVFEDERGQYIFNSKDLALFEFVPRLTEAGVKAFKIEGRMKSIHYIASTVALYRKIIDGANISSERAFELLSRVKNRGYSQGFMKGEITPEDYAAKRNESNSNAVFVGNIIEEKKADNNWCVCEIRNKITAGDELEVLKPDGSLSVIKIDSPITTVKGKTVDVVNNSQFIRIKDDLPKYSILRRIEKKLMPIISQPDAKGTYTAHD